jgi:hypothetical protein
MAEEEEAADKPPGEAPLKEAAASGMYLESILGSDIDITSSLVDREHTI